MVGWLDGKSSYKDETAQSRTNKGGWFQVLNRQKSSKATEGCESDSFAMGEVNEGCDLEMIVDGRVDGC